MKRPNWKIINKIKREKDEARFQGQYREVEPHVFLK